MANAPTTWQPANQEQMDKEYEDYQKQMNRSFATKPPAGKSLWQIMPPVGGLDANGNPRTSSIYKKTWVHYLKDPMNMAAGLKMVGECPQKNSDGADSCAACAAISAFRRAHPDEQSQKNAKEISAKLCIYVNAVRLDSKDKKVVVLELPQTVYKAIEEWRTATREDITDPKAGHQVAINRTGTGQYDTEYHAIVMPKATPIPDMKWLEAMNDLDLVAGHLNMDGAQRMFAGTSETKALPPQGEQAGNYTPPPAGK